MKKLPDSIDKTIQVRYAKEAVEKSSLSCGGALDHAGVLEHEVLADLGCGRGKDIVRAAGLAKYVYGIDFTPEMIKAAEKNLESHKISNAELVEGHIEKIPLPDNSVDIVISNCTINHAADKGKVFSEIFRILKPARRFVVSDIVAEAEVPEDISSDPAAVAGCYGGAVVREDYFAAIWSAGFRHVEILEESKPYEKNGVWLRSLTLRSYKDL